MAQASPTSTQPARSEDEIFAPGGPTVVLVLGGVRKTIRQLPARTNEAWKKQLAETVGAKFLGKGPLDDVDKLSTAFAGLTDAQVELLVAYDEDGRLGGADWILDHAAASEIWTAFKEVLIAAFPFLADAKRAPALVAELLPQLVALVGSKPSTNGAGG